MDYSSKINSPRMSPGQQIGKVERGNTLSGLDAEKDRRRLAGVLIALQPNLPSVLHEARTGCRDFTTAKASALQELWMLARGSDRHQIRLLELPDDDTRDYCRAGWGSLPRVPQIPPGGGEGARQAAASRDSDPVRRAQVERCTASVQEGLEPSLY